jgi:magnesium-transporting ATPase (P-type)
MRKGIKRQIVRKKKGSCCRNRKVSLNTAWVILTLKVFFVVEQIIIDGRQISSSTCYYNVLSYNVETVWKAIIFKIIVISSSPFPSVFLTILQQRFPTYILYVNIFHWHIIIQ